MIEKYFKILAIAFAAAALSACATSGPPPAAAPRPDFQSALDAHLKAIVDKDFESYKTTVTKTEDLHLVFPDGSVLASTGEVLAFHEEWFRNPDWRFLPDDIKVMEGETLAAAFLKYAYLERPDGEPRQAWLVLLFRLEDGEWRLVHDQNTRIPAQEIQ